MSNRVIGLNGAGAYVGTVFWLLIDGEADILPYLILFLRSRVDGRNAVLQEADSFIRKQFADDLANHRVDVEMTKSWFAVDVVINDGDRRFRCQKSDDYDADQAVVKQLLAEYGAFC
jgi:hypothetical protein